MADELLVPFCEAASLSATRDLDSALKKRILVSLCFADPPKLHEALFPQQHIDWSGLEEYLRRENTAYTVYDWITLLKVIDFVNEPPPRAIVAELIASAMASIKVSTQGKYLSPIESMQLCFAKAGIAPAWDVLCKTFVLANLMETDHAAAIHHFLQDMQQYSVHVIDTILKGLSSCKHAPEEYTSTYYVLLSQHCHVRTHVLQNAADARLRLVDHVRQNAQSVYHAHRKPSLTQILQNKKDSNHEIQQDRFQHFCNTCRLASNANVQIKRMLYYLKVIDAPVSAKLLGGHTDAESIAKIPCIVTPDMDALKAFLRDIQHTGPPHQTLRRFKEKCIPGLATWAMVLRFYLAAYCQPVAKELWRYVLSLQAMDLCAATETELGAQRFVTLHAFDIDFVTEMILSDA